MIYVSIQILHVLPLFCRLIGGIFTPYDIFITGHILNLIKFCMIDCININTCALNKKKGQNWNSKIYTNKINKLILNVLKHVKKTIKLPTHQQASLNSVA